MRISGQTRAAADGAILVINCGSSSVKFALFANAEPPARLWSGAIERIGIAESRLHAVDASGAEVLDERRVIADHAQALGLLLDALKRHPPTMSPMIVGHRVVHGGAECDCPLVVNDAVIARLQRLVPLAPLHLPHNLSGIAAVKKARPALPQIACFDTAFHSGLPRLARLTGLPRRFTDQGIQRFGFHGLSYEYVTSELRRRYGPAADKERLVVAHLGNGASMAAIRNGRSVETTMGFSTLAGLPMGTRSGDLDPGLVLYLLTEQGMTAMELQKVLYERSGLLGISGISRNMQELIDRLDAPAAVEAVEFFCYQARKHLAALTGALGGLDRVVFTGGIGANASSIRARICEGLEYLGLTIDPQRNARGERKISTDESIVAVETFPTDEELMIARHAQTHMALEATVREG